jgi:hypothetical protein
MAGFSYDNVRNHPSRDGFDLSQKKLFTAKVGELLPVYWTHVIPGTKFRIKTQWFTRTMPVETSAFTRIREYYDWFFVPYRLLWKYAPEVVTQMQQNVQSAASLTSAVSVSNRFPTTTLGYLDRFFHTLSRAIIEIGSLAPPKGAPPAGIYRKLKRKGKIRMDRRKLHERDIANHRIITKKLNTKIDSRLTANKQNRMTIIPIIVSNQITRNLGFRHKNKIKRLNKSKQEKQAYFHKQTC